MAFLADPQSIVNALVAVLPAGVIFFVAYGRYDGAFRDQTVFLHFIGGMLLGAFLGFLTLLLYSIDAPLLQVLFPALLYPLAIVSVVNRKAWQGERHAIFNGGAVGLGVSVMMGFSLIFALRAGMSAAAVGQTLLLATGLAGILFGLGLLVGDAVRRKKPFRAAIMGTAILIAPSVILVELFQSRYLLWGILLAVYGMVFAIAAERRLLAQGISDEARRERRRRRRAAD